MTYTFIKGKGRINIYKDGEFDHQQFRGHWGYADPEGYLIQLQKWDDEAKLDELHRRADRALAAKEYLARRKARASNNQMELGL